jgi:hypothetical protein
VALPGQANNKLRARSVELPVDSGIKNDTAAVIEEYNINLFI